MTDYGKKIPIPAMIYHRYNEIKVTILHDEKHASTFG